MSAADELIAKARAEFERMVDEYRTTSDEWRRSQLRKEFEILVKTIDEMFEGRPVILQGEMGAIGELFLARQETISMMKKLDELIACRPIVIEEGESDE